MVRAHSEHGCAEQESLGCTECDGERRWLESDKAMQETSCERLGENSMGTGTSHVTLLSGHVKRKQ